MEVVIKGDLEIHRADIKTKAGLVLELQNSSISQRDIRRRELFYGNMIWLINAEIFKQNFSINSIVTQNLRSLDERTHNLLVQNENFEEDLDSSYQFRDEQKEKLNNFILKQESLKRKKN